MGSRTRRKPLMCYQYFQYDVESLYWPTIHYEHTDITERNAEYMRDYNNKDSRPLSFMDHYKVKRPIVTSTHTERLSSISSWTGTCSGMARASFSLGHVSPDWDNLRTSAMSDLYGHMETGMLSLATIGEVGSLKKLGEGFVDVGRELINVLTSKTLLGKAKSLAKFDLGRRFTIQTLLRDLSTAADVTGALNRKLAELQNRNTRSSFKVEASSSDFTDDVQTNSKYVLYGKGKYSMTDAQATLMLIEYFGLTKFASTAWELVPLSFVVDYGLNIGDCISGIENEVFRSAHDHEQISCTGAYTSQKSTSSILSEEWINPNGSYSWKHKFPINGERYTRTPLILDDSFLVSLRASGFSAHQLKTSGELILAMSK